MDIFKKPHLIKKKCRILVLMARLLIFIIALNAFITPVSAMGVCEMMDGSNPAMMAAPISDAMADMDCGMDAETTCASVECISSCSTATVVQLVLEKQTFFIVASNHQPLAEFVYFYRIILPINTPPPLV